MEVRERLIDSEILGCNAHRAPVRHRIARVDGQVQEDLLDLSAVSSYRGEIGRAHGDQLDVLADCPAQECLDVANDAVDVEYLGFLTSLRAKASN
jgi:hypothetical protein